MITKRKPLQELSDREVDFFVYSKIFEHEIKSIGFLADNYEEAYAEKFNIPKYSTDINAAFEVVEKMQEKEEFDFSIKRNVIERYWEVLFEEPDLVKLKSGYCELKDLPLAICFAALRAKGVE